MTGVEADNTKMELSKTVMEKTIADIESGEYQTTGEQIESRGMEDTQFFQAKDKVEAGLELTPEEEEILTARGYDLITQAQIEQVWNERRGGSGGGSSVSGFDKEESDDTFQERTLLFEAIRKRNAGQNLTPEEIALLEKYGLSSQISDQGGRSALSFGGVFK